MDYPAFLPPQAVVDTPAPVWTKAQASLYFAWLLSVKGERVESLLRLAESSDDDPEQDQIDAIDALLYDFLKHEHFAVQLGEVRKLTTAGYALGADCGLFMAKTLLARFPSEVEWVMCRYGGRTYACYNHAVLWGFDLDFDPIHKGIILAKGILSGKPVGVCSRLLLYSSEHVGSACAAQMKIRGRSKLA